MAFTLPTFNLSVNVWHFATWSGNFPSVIPAPDFSVLGNLAMGRREAGGFISNMWLLLPAGTDIRDEEHELINSSHGDMVEVPAGSGRFYGVLESDDAGKGFANEHRVALLTLASPFKVVIPPWPLPYP